MPLDETNKPWAYIRIKDENHTGHSRPSKDVATQQKSLKEHL